MSTLQTWVDTTRRQLMSGRQEQRNVLLGAYTAGSGTLTFSTEITGIVPGARLSVGLNNFYVLTVNSSAQSATVVGGQDGTTDANAAGSSMVRVNPRFTDFEIVSELQNDLIDLSSPGNGLFQVTTVALTADLGLVGYDLAPPAGFIDIYNILVANSPVGTYKDWSELDQINWRLDRNASTSLFPSGYSLQLFWPLSTGNAIRVQCRVGFTIPTALTDNLTTTGLPTTAYDIPPLGAAMRLMAPREIKRNFTEAQGDSRRSSEVPAGAVANSFRPLGALRAQRIASEAGRLVAAYVDKRW